MSSGCGFHAMFWRNACTSCRCNLHAVVAAVLMLYGGSLVDVRVRFVGDLVEAWMRCGWASLEVWSLIGCYFGWCWDEIWLHHWCDLLDMLLACLWVRFGWGSGYAWMTYCWCLYVIRLMFWWHVHERGLRFWLYLFNVLMISTWCAVDYWVRNAWGWTIFWLYVVEAWVTLLDYYLLRLL